MNVDVQPAKALKSRWWFHFFDFHSETRGNEPFCLFFSNELKPPTSHWFLG